MNDVVKNVEDDLSLLKTEVFRNMIITVISSFPFFYVFGALLLWQYLDMQNLRGEFPLLLASNNLLISIALLGVFAALIMLFYLLYAQYLLKSTLKTNNILINEKSRYSLIGNHFFILFTPLFLLIAAKLVVNNDWFVFIFCSLVYPVIGYFYWCFLRRSTTKTKDDKKSFKEHLNVIPYTFLVVFLVFYNITPLLIIIKAVEKVVEGDQLSFIVLGLSFAFYSLFVAFLTVLNNRKHFMIAIAFMIIGLLIVVLKFSNVPLNTAKMIGLGHACVDLTLKEKASSEPFLKELNILSKEFPSKLTNVYVLLHKNKSEYIVSTGYGTPAQRIPYSDILNEGFLKGCPEINEQ